jgi:hypothetical protein
MQGTILLLCTFVVGILSQCSIVVPPNPLTAVGLATPYYVSGCDQTNFNEASFVQGVILDTTLGAISVYNPIMINAGTTPAIKPTVPTLPANNVVGLWFGSNSGTITLVANTTGGGNSLKSGVCVNGNITPFGQFAYCNAVAWFAAANNAIESGLITVPNIGVAVDNLPCPTTRDYFLVDQDQSDNVDATYIVSSTGKIAQYSAANLATLSKQGAVTIMINPSDNRLLNFAVSPALGCKPWTVPDLVDPGSFVPALPLNELQAAAFQSTPLAIIPEFDPMVLESGLPNLQKVNLYRAGVNQPQAASFANANTFTYCTNIRAIQLPRLVNNMALLLTKPSLLPSVANNLFTFLAARFQVSFSNNGGLNCTGILNAPNPVTTVTNSSGVVISATITLPTPPNPNCAIIVPNNPLTAAGLSTPYQLTALNPADGPCHQANPLQASFVQGAIINTATGAISIYNPLVIDEGTKPAVAPVVPTLPANSVVGLWFGSNAGTLTLKGASANTLTNANCVNGDAQAGIFGQFAYCNAVAFFAAANTAINSGKLVVPPLGTALDLKPCPTTRDFAIVDMDPNDNVVTSYLVTENGLLAQNTAANRAKFAGTTLEINGSDETLLSVLIDSVIGCTPWKAPDLADPGSMLPALPLNELQASRLQLAPQAKVPKNDPMVVDGNGNPNLNKLNEYRVGVNQNAVANVNTANTTLFCQRMGSIAPTRFLSLSEFLITGASPSPTTATNLFTFIAQRFMTAFGPGGLNCTGLLGVEVMIEPTYDNDGVLINAEVDTGGILPVPPNDDPDSQPYASGASQTSNAYTVPTSYYYSYPAPAPTSSSWVNVPSVAIFVGIVALFVL